MRVFELNWKAVAFTVLMVMLAGILIGTLSGCSVGISGGITMDGYYPDIRTKTGGGFGDPARSRHESVHPATSHVRNNDGNSVDRFLKKFFDTSPNKLSARK